jgi:hypothetical protein
MCHREIFSDLVSISQIAILVDSAQCCVARSCDYRVECHNRISSRIGILIRNGFSLVIRGPRGTVCRRKPRVKIAW